MDSRELAHLALTFQAAALAGGVASSPGHALGAATLAALAVGVGLNAVELALLFCLLTLISLTLALALIGLPGVGAALGVGVPAALWGGWVGSLLARRWLGLR